MMPLSICFNYPNQMSRGSRNHSVQQDLQTILLLSTPRDKDEKYGKVLESRVGWSFPPRGIGVGNKHVKCDLSYRGWDHTTKRSRGSWSILLIFIASNHPCLVIIVGAFGPNLRMDFWQLVRKIINGILQSLHSHSKYPLPLSRTNT